MIGFQPYSETEQDLPQRALGASRDHRQGVLERAANLLKFSFEPFQYLQSFCDPTRRLIFGKKRTLESDLASRMKQGNATSGMLRDGHG